MTTVELMIIGLAAIAVLLFALDMALINRAYTYTYIRCIDDCERPERYYMEYMRSDGKLFRAVYENEEYIGWYLPGEEEKQ